jgi:N6-adenosine-specific RNA methylase IME4
MASCILYQNADQTLTLLDIPRTIEQAQGFQKNDNKRIISSKEIEQPFTSIEPKSARALRNVEATSVKSLLLERFITLALEEVQTAFKRLWCFARITQDSAALNSQALIRQSVDIPEVASRHAWDSVLETERNSTHSRIDDSSGSHPHTMEQFTPDVLYHNEGSVIKQLEVGSESRIAYIPPRSSFLPGDIENTGNIFNYTAPQFDLVILDPPWPNRSARRKQSYRLSPSTPDAAALLSSIPLASHLAEHALVGIWVTNKPAIHALILDPNGLFDSWGLELVEEWVWVKVTASGEPICALDSTWRKPYEILLVGRKRGFEAVTENFKRRVIIGVPDLHSRKPNLKILFEPMLPSKYEALEVFARNLTAGWWAWGNEVLKFQSEEHWHDISSDT